MTPQPRPNTAGLRAAYEASTQDEWHGCHDGECICGYIWAKKQDFPIAKTNFNHDEDLGMVIESATIIANAKFIALAHEQMPLLLAHIEELEGLCRRAARYVIDRSHFIEDRELAAELQAASQPADGGGDAEEGGG